LHVPAYRTSDDVDLFGDNADLFACSLRTSDICAMPDLDLRAFREDDGPVLMRVLGAPQVARWLAPAGRGAPVTVAECAARARAGAAHWLAHGFGPWLVCEGADTVACGGLGLRLLDGRPELELAWAVLPDAWGRGIATAIGREALALARARGAREVVALTRVDNLASRRVMDKLGMSPDRELRHAGLPHVLYRVESLRFRTADTCGFSGTVRADRPPRA
jgi:RimJ/RimL family protein N-acetyltransferase